MKEDNEIADLLAKTKRSIQAAEVLLKEGLDDFSASRSYYPCSMQPKRYYCRRTYLSPVTKQLLRRSEGSL